MQTRRPTLCESPFSSIDFYYADMWFLQAHAGKKEYCCNVCGKSFITNGGLVVHAKVGSIHRLILYLNARKWQTELVGKL